MHPGLSLRTFLTDCPGRGRPQAAGDPEFAVSGRRQDHHLPLQGKDPGQRGDIHLVGDQDEVSRGGGHGDEQAEPAGLFRFPVAVVEERIRRVPRLRGSERQPRRFGRNGQDEEERKVAHGSGPSSNAS